MKPASHHGTNNGYVNYGCRCAPCKRAASEYNAAKRYPHPTRPGVLVSRQRIAQLRQWQREQVG